jgi:hypothetical protein
VGLVSAVRFTATREMEPCIDCGEDTGGLVIWPDRTYFRQCIHCRRADAAIEAAAGEPDTATRATRTRQASAGEDRPCAAAPGDAAATREYPALKRPRQGQAASRSPSASLDPSTGPGASPLVGQAAPGRLRRCPGDDGEDRTKLRARITAALNGGPEQGEQPRRPHKSKAWELPLDLCDTPGESCECGAVVWTASNGKIIGRYHSARKKGCPRCGRQLRARYWQGYGPILAAAGADLRRWEGSEAEWKRLGPKLRKAGYQALPIPVLAGRIIYTTMPIGQQVEDLPGQLAADLLVMADDARRMRATGSAERPGWRQAWQAFCAADTPPPATGEHVGFSGALSLPRARMWAEHFGLLEQELGDGLVIRDVRESDPTVWYLFAERVGIRKRVPRQAEREVRAA